ncbi:hypothetical protein ACNOYE_30780 [Nannocystaceae bacterium ST9]
MQELEASLARTRPHKRALLIGVADDHPEQRLDPGPTLAAMQGLLDDLGGWTLDVVDGRAATREGILDALARLIAVTGPDDTCLIHYFGHGSVVRFDDVEGPLGRRPIFYVTARRPSATWSLLGVLDVELSLALARLDRICGNVSVILDCCKSGRTVRGDNVPSLPAPAWLPTLPDADECDRLLDVESHPTIVRLTGSSALQIAFGVHHEGVGDLGLLTSGFVEVVREAELRLDRLTWDAVVHRVRERAIRMRNGGEQWIGLAGPRERLVLSARRAALPRSVGYLPALTREVGWLRAGALQGVEVGDEWGIAELALDENLEPRMLGRVRVDQVDLARARVVAASPECRPNALPLGASAYLLSAHDRLAVDVGEIAELASALNEAPLVRAAKPGERSVFARVVRRDHEFELECEQWRVRVGSLAAVLEWLDDWARADRLSRITRRAPSSSERRFDLRWGWFEGSARRTAPASGEVRLRLAHRPWFELAPRGRGDCFVAAIELGIGGSPRLLNAAEPDGVALLPGAPRQLGERAGRRSQGFEIDWPIEVARDRAQPVSVIVLASPRPLELGHLVRTPAELALVRRPARASSNRSLGRRSIEEQPESVDTWTWQAIQYVVEPS